MIRIGQSEDVHALKEGRDLYLGGVKIASDLGLDGHSDADVLLHAISEALIGAMGLNDLGTHFSDKDEAYKGISSLVILGKVYEMLQDRGYHVVNIDSLVMIEKPRLAPYINDMRLNIAKALHIDIDQVNVKATCAEGLGYIGNRQGAKAQAVVLISSEKNYCNSSQKSVE